MPTSGTPEVRALCADRRGRLWVGTHLAGVFCLDGAVVRLPADVPFVQCLLVDADEGLWNGLLGAARSLYRYTEAEGLQRVEDERLRGEHVVQRAGRPRRPRRPHRPAGRRPGAADPGAGGRGPLLSLDAMEHAHLLRALEATGWVVYGDRGAARLLDIHPEAVSPAGASDLDTVSLYHFHGHTCQQVGQTLGISHSAVKWRLREARRRLRLSLEASLDRSVWPES